MIITQLEGKVTSENWDTLQDAFNNSLQQLPSAIQQSYLVQDKTAGDVWRVITIWKSQSALQNYRQSVETPEGVLMFRSAGAEPTLTISEVISHS